MNNKLTLLFALLLSFTISAQKETREIDEFVSELDIKIPELLNNFIVHGTAIAIIEQ